MDFSDTDPKKIVAKPDWQTRSIAVLTYLKIVTLIAFRNIAANGTPLWWIGAVCWGGASFVILSNYQSLGNTEYLNEMWFLFSLLWAQFGVAVALGALFKKNFRLLADRLFMAAFPPLLLHFSLFATIM
ncbi:MAG: hypothetical protein HQL69_17855 [Magnetococcales bacterium]|nr:hypothetical protein [Magnetococcales bacterium]